jgi:hypothetical protein
MKALDPKRACYQQKYFGYICHGAPAKVSDNSPERRARIMTRFVTASAIIATVLMSATAFLAAPAAAAAPNKAAVADANAKCKAQVKEQAKFHEMSLMAKRKATKKCVKDILAGH